MQMSALSLISLADKHRVQLKGVLPDYIHATFVNVTLRYIIMYKFYFLHIIKGLQAQEGIHCGPESHGEYN